MADPKEALAQAQQQAAALADQAQRIAALEAEVKALRAGAGGPSGSETLELAAAQREVARAFRDHAAALASHGAVLSDMINRGEAFQRRMLERQARTAKEKVGT